LTAHRPSWRPASIARFSLPASGASADDPRGGSMTGRVDYDPAKHAGERGVTCRRQRHRSPARPRANRQGVCRELALDRAAWATWITLPLRYFSDLQTIATAQTSWCASCWGRRRWRSSMARLLAARPFLVTVHGHAHRAGPGMVRSVSHVRLRDLPSPARASPASATAWAGFKAKHDPGEDPPFAFVPVAVNLGPGGRRRPSA